jgi:serine/threonine-protein kinase
MGLVPPRFAGRYLLIEEIGAGGMATVHLARVDGPGGFRRWFAIKRIFPHLMADDHLVDMFLDEARTAARINHANVVQVFEIGRDEETYWLAMEYLHGDPLREVLRRSAQRGARVPPAIAARICADAAAGLHAAHELRTSDGIPLGLVHRDVSPHNLFITDDGHTKIVDFGIAKTAERLAQHTCVGVLKGKLAYMSPEQVKGEPVDRTTDVFALGVVLWEMTTGQRLFRAETDLDTLARVFDCVVPRPSAIVPGYPPELEAVVLRALARRKEDRYATARDMARALERWLARSGEFAGVEEVASFVRALYPDRIARRDARIAAAAEDDRVAWPQPLQPSIEDDEEELATTILVHPERTASLGDTIAIPASFGPPPSPAYAPPPVLAPASPYRIAPIAPAPPAPIAPAPLSKAALVVMGVLLAMLAVLAVLAVLLSSHFTGTMR